MTLHKDPETIAVTLVVCVILFALVFAWWGEKS